MGKKACLFFLDPRQSLENQQEGAYKMNIVLWSIIIIGGSVGLLSSLYCIFSLVAVIGFKIYRMIKYGASLYD